MIQEYTPIDEIASRIDISLCDACGAIRMRDEYGREHEGDDDPLRVRTPSEATAILLSQVRRDIGALSGEVRSGFSQLEKRVRELELKDARSEGALAGVKGTMAVIATVSTLMGGLIGWLISLVTRSTK